MPLLSVLLSSLCTLLSLIIYLSLNHQLYMNDTQLHFSFYPLILTLVLFTFMMLFSLSNLELLQIF